jgi:hypothetical protein
LALVVASAPALATSVGVSVTVGEPGYRGRIDIVDFPPPQLLFPEPIIIEAVPARVVRPPVYVYVPATEAKQWRKFCKKYKACGQPVYFVQDTWYNEVYVPEYRKVKGKKHKEKPGKPKKPKNE